MEEVIWNDLRCSKCNKLLGKGDYKGKISIKCDRCKTINEYKK
ncbi:Com family DNA-binding transcriptional regulator [Halobacillus litoralis]|nr:Com family DNA-binding transcriptional regulator [Halobacillus litoralis]